MQAYLQIYDTIIFLIKFINIFKKNHILEINP